MKKEVIFHGIKSIDMLAWRVGGCTGSSRIIENLNPIWVWSPEWKLHPHRLGDGKMSYHSPGLCPPTCMSSRKFGFSSIIVWCMFHTCFLCGSLSGLNSIESLSLHSPQWLEGRGAPTGQDWLMGKVRQWTEVEKTANSSEKRKWIQSTLTTTKMLTKDREGENLSLKVTEK